MMDRRDFFRTGARKTAEIAYQVASDRAARRAQSWLRPPFAVDELDFLLACTRCDKCIEACPHHVLFKLPARLGLRVAGTPAMDLLNRVQIPEQAHKYPGQLSGGQQQRVAIARSLAMSPKVMCPPME